MPSLHDQAGRAEYDAVVASGELITAGLNVRMVQDMGMPSRSCVQGWQIPLLTDDAHGGADIGHRRQGDPRWLRAERDRGRRRLSGLPRADRPRDDARARRLGYFLAQWRRRGAARRSVRHLHRRRRSPHHRSTSCPGPAASTTRRVADKPGVAAAIFAARGGEHQMST